MCQVSLRRGTNLLSKTRHMSYCRAPPVYYRAFPTVGSADLDDVFMSTFVRSTYVSYGLGIELKICPSAIKSTMSGSYYITYSLSDLELRLPAPPTR